MKPLLQNMKCFPEHNYAHSPAIVNVSVRVECEECCTIKHGTEFTNYITEYGIYSFI